MKTHLRDLQKWVTTIVMCVVSLTVAGVEITSDDVLDFTGTSVTVSGLPMTIDQYGEDISLNSVYTYLSMGEGDRPVYESVINGFKYFLQWKDYDNFISSTESEGWVFIAEGAIGNTFYNIQPTDSVPLNGWLLAASDDYITINLSGCYEDNEIIDPYYGTQIEVYGTDYYNGTYTYYGMESYYPAFSDTISSDSIVTLLYDYGWKLRLNGVNLYTNTFFDKDNIYVPESNWVDANAAYGTRGNIMYITPLYDVTVNPHEDKGITIVDPESGGEYVYNSLINDYPSYYYVDGVLKYVIMRNDTAWFVKKGSTQTDFSRAGTTLNYSTLIDFDIVPQNGWSQYEENTPSVSGTATQFVFLGEAITVSQSDNGDIDGVFDFVEVDDGFVKFSMVASSGIYQGFTLTLSRGFYDSSYKWLIETFIDDTETVLYANEHMINIHDTYLIPQNLWVNSSGEASSISFSGDATADVYTESEVSILGNESVSGIYVYAGLENDMLSFILEDMKISFKEGAWTLSQNGTNLFVSSKDLQEIPKNGWHAVSGDATILLDDENELTQYVFTGEELVVTGSDNNELDGIYIFKELVNDYVVFSMTPSNGEELLLTYNSSISAWDISANGSNVSLATNSQSVYDALSNAIVPQNYWSNGMTITGDYSAYVNGVQISGSSDFDGIYVFDETYYGASINSADYKITLVTQDDVTQWEIGYIDESNDVILATNTNISGTLIPQNGWMISGESSTISISGDSTFYVTDGSGLIDQYYTALTIYPNPTSSLINISAATAGRLEVYSLAGVCVMTNVLTEGTNIISVSLLPSGSYLFVTEINSKKSVARVLVH